MPLKDGQRPNIKDVVDFYDKKLISKNVQEIAALMYQASEVQDSFALIQTQLENHVQNSQ